MDGIVHIRGALNCPHTWCFAEGYEADHSRRVGVGVGVGVGGGYGFLSQLSFPCGPEQDIPHPSGMKHSIGLQNFLLFFMCGENKPFLHYLLNKLKNNKKNIAPGVSHGPPLTQTYIIQERQVFHIY